MKALLALALAVQAAQYVKVTATFLPARAGGGEATIAVHLSPLDPNVRVNEDPPPRLKLDQGQQVLAEKPVARKPRPGKGPARYLDPAVPVAFPVTVTARAARGEHVVKGAVTYFYCSKSEGWCRKGTADIEVPVRVP